VKDSGKSVCMGECLVTWPALTVEAGETPTGGAGVTGTLGTITREDDGTLQVTYNGLPLYFFKNDAEPGDLNGVYENWETVAP
jgi:predicted lipoprotein with Yx(FWY)xxD motif